VWQIDAVLVPATSSPSPAPQLKSLTTLLSGGSTFAAALAAAPSLATAVKQSSFRGTLLAPTDQVGDWGREAGWELLLCCGACVLHAACCQAGRWHASCHPYKWVAMSSEVQQLAWGWFIRRFVAQMLYSVQQRLVSLSSKSSASSCSRS
jgi:hypothetical protein